MDKAARMTKSRNQWKDKARGRAEELREARKLIKRQKQHIEDLKEASRTGSGRQETEKK